MSFQPNKYNKMSQSFTKTHLSMPTLADDDVDTEYSQKAGGKHILWQTWSQEFYINTNLKCEWRFG